MLLKKRWYKVVGKKKKIIYNRIMSFIYMEIETATQPFDRDDHWTILCLKGHQNKENEEEKQTQRST